MPRFLKFVLTTPLLFCTYILPVQADMEKAEAAFAAGDYATAFTEYSTEYDNGNVEAMVRLAQMYFQGLGVTKQPAAGSMYLEKAAGLGNREAQYAIAVAYTKGIGFPQNLEKAAGWFKKAAEQGDPVSQFNLGVMYGSGQGVDRNLEKAFHWYEQAAMAGERDAQYNLALMYMAGEGVAKSYAEAQRWFYEAAFQRMPQAQWQLGSLLTAMPAYDSGGKLAYMWVEISRRNGIEEALQMLANFEMEMAPEIITEAQQLADEWFDYSGSDEYGNSAYVYYPPSAGKANDSRFAPKLRIVETPGSLAATRSTGCVAIDSLTSGEIPPNIYRGVADCIDKEDYAKAFPLMMMGRIFGVFDAYRVSDPTAGDGIVVLEMNTTEPVPQDRLDALNDYLAATGVPGSAGMSATCRDIRKIGYPAYHPDYMINYGVDAAGNTGGSGLKEDFDAEEIWAMVLAQFCGQPVAVQE